MLMEAAMRRAPDMKDGTIRHPKTPALDAKQQEELYQLKIETLKARKENPEGFSMAETSLGKATAYFSSMLGMPITLIEILVDKRLEGRNCAAAYNRKRNTISINPKSLSSENRERLPSVMAHEDAHAIRGMQNLIADMNQPTYHKHPNKFEETAAIFCAAAFETSEIKNPEERIRKMAANLINNPTFRKISTRDVALAIIKSFAEVDASERKRVEESKREVAALTDTQKAEMKRLKDEEPYYEINSDYISTHVYAANQVALSAMELSVNRIQNMVNAKGWNQSSVPYIFGDAISLILASEGKIDDTVKALLTSPESEITDHISRLIIKSGERISMAIESQNPSL